MEVHLTWFCCPCKPVVAGLPVLIQEAQCGHCSSPMEGPFLGPYDAVKFLESDDREAYLLDAVGLQAFEV